MAKKGDERREAIAAAAADLFWRCSFAGSSIGDIARAAGVPQGNMFYYYKTKADIALAVADIFLSETSALVAEAANVSTEAEERCRFLLRRLQQSNRSRMERGCPISLAVRDFRDGAPDASARAAESFTRLMEFLAGEFGRSGQRPSQALSHARSLIAEWQGGIALAHAFSDMTILAESFRRMDATLGRAFSGNQPG
ncbi:TetR/AcrR family transcriptional regulator [Pseudohoeflea suaedae]|uniref:TetR/AcrR family transcriptional regulator n=1 Tax=Pseudohoeflea suaedae TaxID=877384 RepID=A0A4R5PLE5_9HYPH|nr:TetR/AcrR family transcriptional regulator [Pseudohoeflea suaedae]TDH37764.1 TetR/AcrR family transcriptional regulator [Pseudohoeflea suaedae]